MDFLINGLDNICYVLYLLLFLLLFFTSITCYLFLDLDLLICLFVLFNTYKLLFF